MAKGVEPRRAHKRAASKAVANEPRPDKKRKISTTISTPISSPAQSSKQCSPVPETPVQKLPPRISEHRPLPTLSEPPAVALSNEEYQSLSASGVLQSSLDRSRLRWVGEGILEKYWVKPESRKNARLPLPNNPDLKWQKHKGPCRIRIEPHIFEAEVYVEEKTKPPAPPAPKPYIPPYHGSAYGQPYRPNHSPFGQQQYYQNRTLPPIQHGHSPSGLAPPGNNGNHSPAPPPPPPRQPPSQSQSQAGDKKASPDPVISMLASRASSDPELKALMKEVATGSATAEQLEVFQAHIDELTKVINDKKKKEEEEAIAAEAVKATQMQQGEVIQYDGASDQTNLPQPPVPPPQQPRPFYAPGQMYQQPQPPAWQTPPPPPPPAPLALPVILAFTTPGASEDRFLFPQNSILESLSPQHLLASFLVTRKGSEAVDPTGLEPETEYYQPVTMMVEVAYNREHIIDSVRRWVKPAEEVEKQMKEVMERCTRAPETFLPLRLPFKGTAMALTEDMIPDTPPPEIAEEGKKRKGVKYVKKNKKAEEAKKDEEVKKDEVATTPANVTGTEQNSAPTTVAETTETETKDANGGAEIGEVKKDEAVPETNAETGRPRRAVRKSVRISEA